MRFCHPAFLWLFLLIPILWWLVRRFEKSKRATVRFPDVTHVKQLPLSRGVRWRPVVWMLRIVTISLLIVALARPQQGRSERKVRSEGIAIALVIDCSDSMRADDFAPNRLGAAKRVIGEFVDGRENDEICAVIYGSSSLLACPLTLDYSVLKDLVNRLDFRLLGKDFIKSTAIGLGLANALQQLEKSEAKSKVVILLTDGRNNAGDVSPLKAAELAATLGTKVYTIGVGTKESDFRGDPFAVWWTRSMQRDMDLDEDMLKQIAEMANGKYFRADDVKKLKAIYDEIDQLEKHEIELERYDSYDEKMSPLVAGAALFLLLEILLGYTRLRKLP